MPVTDHLLRDLAPVPANAWRLLDDEARERLTPLLAARRLVDWVGPGGWTYDAVPLGRTSAVDGPPPGTSAPGAQTRRRTVQPLVEVRIPFTVERGEIEDIQRGAKNPQLDDLDRAAREAALVENRAVFHGWPAAGIVGMTEAASYDLPPLGDDCRVYPTAIALAVDRLRRAGIAGPYALAITPDRYTRILETTEHGGYLLLDHLKRILGGGPVIWAPGLDSAIVASTRGGGDFLFDAGQDISIGYSHHDADTVHLYFEQSFTFRVVEPDAALALN